MKRFKKTIATVMCIVMMLTAAPLSGFVGMELNLDWINFDWIDFNTKASAAEYSGTCGADLTWNYDDSANVLTISGNGDMYDFNDDSFPWESYEDCAKEIIIEDGVTSIDNKAFYSFDKVINIKIGKSVTNIGNHAFLGCAELTSVTIPDSVTNIGRYAFTGCTKLESITIGDSLSTIGGDAFSGCTSLKSVYISDLSAWCNIYFPAAIDSSYKPEKSTPLYYGADLYLNGEKLTNLVIPDDVTEIKNFTFYNCSSITSIEFSDSVSSIGKAAFYNCKGVTSLEVPNSVTSIGSAAFQGMTELENLSIPFVGASREATSYSAVLGYIFGYTRRSDDECGWSTYEYINSECGVQPENTTWQFSCAERSYSSSSSTRVTYWRDGYYYYIPSSLTCVTITDATKIGTAAFNNCSNLTDININDGVTSIGDYAFQNCTGITETGIPGTVETIGKYAFKNCTAIKNISMPDALTSIGNDPFLNTAFYNDADNWENDVMYIDNYLITAKSSISGNCEIKEGTVVIADSAFADCVELKGVTIPNSVTGIGASMFSGCSGLANVVISDSVTSIGDRAFYNCDSITNITIPDSVTNIGSFAFNLCEGLSVLTMPVSAKIGRYAFSACSGIVKITLTKGTGIMQNYAEHDYSHLKDTYYEYTPWYESQCTNIYIEPGVTHIGASAFYNNTELTSIEIPDSVRTIGSYAFGNCYKLTSIEIPDGVRGIGSYAFSGCGKFTSVTIPDSVTSVNDYAFKDCTRLIELTMPVSADVSDTAFENTNIQKITLTKGTGVMKSFNSYTSGKQIAIVIEDGVTEIVDYAFYDCDNIVSITIPDSVTNIGWYAFADCDSLVRIEIPDSVTSIGKSAFSNTAYYNDANNWENDVLYIDNHLIEAKSSISGNCEIKEGTLTIADKAFYNCNKLANITLPDSVTSIGASAFSDTAYYNNANNWENDVLYIDNHLIKAKSSISGNCEIKEGTLTIADKAFYNCNRLTNITIPDSVTTVGNSTFAGCSNLSTVYYCASENEWNDISIDVGNDSLVNAAIHYNYNSTSHYKAVITPPTCIEQGYTTYTCECGDSYVSDYVDATGHSYTSEVTTPATHTATGVMTNTCYCGDTYTETIAKIEKHSYNAVITSPTCEEKGYTTYTCECGDNYVADYVDATGHSYTSEVTTPATHTATGVMTYTCHCGDTYTETIAKIEKHSYNAVITSPTCEEKGYTTYTCECGDSYVDDYVDAKGHTAGEWVVTKPATSTQSGTKTQSCTVCETVLKTETIPAYGKVSGVSVDNISMNYKDSTTITPYIDIDAGVGYTVSYSSSNNSVARVDENGSVYAAGKGSATITVTVTDQFGNAVTDTCDVSVNYSFGQWLIIILLFGWIWY